MSNEHIVSRMKRLESKFRRKREKFSGSVDADITLLKIKIESLNKKLANLVANSSLEAIEEQYEKEKRLTIDKFMMDLYGYKDEQAVIERERNLPVIRQAILDSGLSSYEISQKLLVIDKDFNNIYKLKNRIAKKRFDLETKYLQPTLDFL